MSKIIALAVAFVVAASAANAATIVNLSADATNPNAGTSSGTYTYNPVSVTLGAGTYAVSVVGIAGGGTYDAYTVSLPVTATSGSYTDGNWSVNVGGTVQTQGSTQRFNTAAASLSYYSALTPITFTLTGTTTVAFYLDDTSYPYFADDAGGVSLSVKQVSVPEPGSLAVLGVALSGVGMIRRRRKAANA